MAVVDKSANDKCKYLPIKGPTYLSLSKRYPVYKPCIGSGETCLMLEIDLHKLTTHRWAVLLEKLKLIHLLKLGRPDSNIISLEALERFDQNTLNYKYLSSGDNAAKGGAKEDCVSHKSICNGETGENRCLPTCSSDCIGCFDASETLKLWVPIYFYGLLRRFY